MASNGEAAKAARLFFALWPDATVRRRLAEQAAACDRHCRGRPIPSENLHLTLAFLGAVDADVRGCLEATAARITLPPFELVFDRLGFWARAQVAWIGCRELPPTAAELAAELQRAVVACGLTSERRPFHAHVTLRRRARRGPRPEAIEPVVWPVREFALVRSHTLPEGARYEVVRRWPLSVPAAGTGLGTPIGSME